jgi:precorrin-6Y C5,15-methyltransferase (decarboxylating)
LVDAGFRESRVTVMEALGGPRERVTTFAAIDKHQTDFQHPVCVAVEVHGQGAPVPKASGRPDALFETDGVMTKRPVRAMTLSALAPVSGELLWDIGGGSGSVAIEWLLADTHCEAITIEPRKDRVALIGANATALGVDRLQVITGHAPEVLTDLPKPHAVFIGGGLGAGMIAALETLLPAGTRVVANAVTLEAEALLTALHGQKGGDLLRIEIAQARPLGGKTGWKAAYPVVQWSGVL